jgi:hypothetical protein
VQCIKAMPCQILEFLTFVYFYTLNFVRDITLKLQFIHIFANIYYRLGVNFKECEGASITYNEIYAFALQSV